MQQNEKPSEYSPQEIMVASAAKEIHNREVVFVGIGLPVLACLLAQRLHAPDMVMVYEAGVIGARPARLALSIGDPTLASDSTMIVDFHDVFALLLQRGLVDASFLGGAQVDKYGNVNSTVIGPYETPKVRLPGSGGACDLAMAKRGLIIMPHEKRRLVEKVDFVTSPGHMGGPEARKKRGTLGGGPSAVITTLGILRFDKDTGEMYLDSCHPGVSVEEVRQNTGWDLKVSPTIRQTEPPTAEELRLLREQIDPRGIFLKRPVG